MAPEMEFCLLGPLVIRKNGSVVPLSAPKQRVMMAALLLRAGRVVTLDTLAEAVWGGGPPASARVTLQNYARRLRCALGDTSRSLIATMPQGYQINVADGELDPSRFQALRGEARQATLEGGWEEAAARLREALALWRGEPLTGVPSDALLQREKPRLVEMHSEALEARIDADLQLGRHGAVIAELRQFSAAHPLRERPYGMLMLALYRDGRRADALAAYQNARHVLVSELGLEPGPDLRDLHQRILSADPALLLPRDPAADARAVSTLAPGPGAPSRPGGGESADSGSGAPTAWPVIPRQLPAAVRHFAGRQAELKALAGLLDEAAGGAGTVAISVINGTAGIGKTTLALHFAHQVADRFPDGQLYVNLRGFDPSGEPVTPAEVIRGFLDALGVPPEQMPTDVEVQAGLYRSLAADRRILVLLDNASDTAQVRPLLPATPGSHVLVTSRHRLGELAISVGAHELTLDVLTHTEAYELLARRLGAERTARESRAVGELTELCDRLPLALAIVAARAAAHPGFPLTALAAQLRDARGRLDALDAGENAADVRAVLSWSYQRLSEAAARMFRLIGLHPGPGITAAAAASLAGCTVDHARHALLELTSAHMLTEHAPGRYAFHDLLRAYAAERAEATDDEAARRTAIHRVLDHYLHTAHAAALTLARWRYPITLAAPQPGVTPERPASDREALVWFGAEHHVLLAAIDRAATDRYDEHAWQLAWALADFLDRSAYWDEYAATQRTALAAAQRLGDRVGQAHAHHHLGQAQVALGAYENAHRHLGQALGLHRESGNRAGEARAHLDIATVLARENRHRDAIGHDHEGLRLFHKAGHSHGVARALNSLGWDLAHVGEHETAISRCREALGLLRELGDRYGQAAVWHSLGSSYDGLGDHAEAAACYRHTLDLLDESEDRYHVASTLTSLGNSHAAIGNQKAAREAWQRALPILHELRHPDAEQVRARLRGEEAAP
jgi:DNA-binding SARP family transcriptional activator/tetratricopeptide (TPR) repeat protein